MTPPRIIQFANISDYFPTLPLAWGLLRAHAETDPRIQEAYLFAPPLFLPEPAGRILRRIQEEPAVFAASSYVWNFALNMKLFRVAKERWPGCVTIAGGPHIPDVPGDFFTRHPYVDILIHGEGEVPFRKVLLALLDETPALEGIPGLSLNRNGQCVSTGAPKPLPLSLGEDVIPSPWLLGYFDPLMEQARAPGKGVWALFESNRGCPYGCTFCEWGAASMDRIKQFDMERLKAELDHIISLDVDWLYFTDANFGILERDLDLTRHLVSLASRHGSPREFMTNFAKNSDQRVLEISTLLTRAGLFRGTTLALQSTSPEVLKAVRRTNLHLERYQDLKRAYDQAGVPTYTDLILGLPLETRESWMGGLCRLLRAGQHEDIRVFELYLLPNTPMNTPEARERYGLQTRLKRLNARADPEECGEAEVVVETSTLSHADWHDCMLFTDVFISTLHNGGFTRFLSKYLEQTGKMTYEQFYIGMFNAFRSRLDTFLGSTLERLAALYQQYVDDPEIPAVQKVRSQPDMRSFLRPYQSKVKYQWWPHEWAWMQVLQNEEAFWGEICGWLAESGLDPQSEELSDLLAFQRDLMLREDYNPLLGKDGNYAHDWHRYFFGDGVLATGRVHVRFTDTSMGNRRQHPLKPDDPKSFALAALGNYLTEGRVRCFFHQPDQMQVTPAAPLD